MVTGKVKEVKDTIAKEKEAHGKTDIKQSCSNGAWLDGEHNLDKRERIYEVVMMKTWMVRKRALKFFQIGRNSWKFLGESKGEKGWDQVSSFYFNDLICI